MRALAEVMRLPAVEVVSGDPEVGARYVAMPKPTVTRADLVRSTITRSEFGSAWTDLCKRFGRTPEREEAKAYLDYLEGMGVTTEDALAACRALWATARFWPRPADFLAWKAEGEWRRIVRLVNAPDAEVVAGWRELSLQAREAMESLGGLDAVRSSRDLVRVRTAYFDAYERTVAFQAGGERGDRG